MFDKYPQLANITARRDYMHRHCTHQAIKIKTQYFQSLIFKSTTLLPFPPASAMQIHVAESGFVVDPINNSKNRVVTNLIKLAVFSIIFLTIFLFLKYGL